MINGKENFFCNGSKQEDYLIKIFTMLKKRDEIVVVDKKTNFNNTELRMFSEILIAKAKGERLISTQLAKRLGITRSAVSQIVKRLEENGVIKRMPDKVDRKISYVELSEGMLDLYGEDIEECLRFIDGLVQEFGEENFETMYELFISFINLAQKKLKSTKNNTKRGKVC